MVVSVCKFEEKTLIQKISLCWFLNRNLKLLLTIFFTIIFFSNNFFSYNFFFYEFFFPTNTNREAIGNATLNLWVGIIISKM